MRKTVILGSLRGASPQTSEGYLRRSCWRDAPERQSSEELSSALVGTTPQALAHKIPYFSPSFFISKPSKSQWFLPLTLRITYTLNI